jgi:hypothetical protein
MFPVPFNTQATGFPTIKEMIAHQRALRKEEEARDAKLKADTMVEIKPPETMLPLHIKCVQRLARSRNFDKTILLETVERVADLHNSVWHLQRDTKSNTYKIYLYDNVLRLNYTVFINKKGEAYVPATLTSFSGRDCVNIYRVFVKCPYITTFLLVIGRKLYRVPGTKIRTMIWQGTNDDSVSSKYSIFMSVVAPFEVGKKELKN